MTLAARWQALRAETPNVRTRDAAATLHVAEAELVETLVGTTATRLDTDAASLLHAFPEVGRCMALTRNEHAVSEVRGTYGGIELGSHAGQVVGDGVDLRVFLDHWKHAYALTEPHHNEPASLRRSIHVFDRTGTAVHKIYLEPEGNPETWDAIVAARAKSLPLQLETAPPRKPERPDADVDVAPFHAAWDAMQDTHEFFHLLGKHQLTRTQALRLAGVSRARRVHDASLDRLLRELAVSDDKIMIFVGNRGCLQIFSGMVRNIVVRGPWLNVMDPGFNLHLRADKIAQSWVVAKPASTGVVSSLELFDADGEVIALVFRKRADRDLAEDPAWRGRLAGMETV